MKRTAAPRNRWIVSRRACPTATRQLPRRCCACRPRKSAISFNATRTSFPRSRRVGPEAGAAEVCRDARPDTDDMAQRLTQYLQTRCGVTVRLEKADAMNRATRRYDAARRELTLSE